MNKITKKGLKEEFGVSYLTMRRIFCKDVVEVIIGFDYEIFKKIKIVPAFVAERMRLYFYNGDTFVPEEGIYRCKVTEHLWVIHNISPHSRTADFQELDKYGMLGERKIKNIPFNLIKMEYIHVKKEKNEVQDN
jgi:hypothetical protein